MRFALTIALPALGVLGLGACRGGESKDPPIHLIHNMDTQEVGRAYRADTTGLFADGRMMRRPVEGTVAIGHLAEDDLLHRGVDEKAQPTLTFPEMFKTSGKVDAGVRARGEERYAIFCTPCHNANGDGQGPLAQKSLDGGQRLVVPPANLLDARIKSMPVGKIYTAITDGVNAGNMPAYAAQIPVDDRWAIVAWVRELQRRVDPGVADEGGEILVVTQASASSVEHGEQLFKAKGCNVCHSLDGTRLVGPTFKGLWGKTESTSAGDVVVDEAYVKESILEPNAKVVTGFPPAMPPTPLTDIELGSMYLFMKAQK